MRTARNVILGLVGSLALVGAVGCEQKTNATTHSGSPPPASTTQGSHQPNVLLVSIDTLRADHLSSYGYDRKTSPEIDRLASEGVVFEQMVSSTSWTLPSHASMLTGLSDSVHGVDRNDRYLKPERRTLAESLREAGYRTAGFYSGPYLHPIYGMDQGFDDYISCASEPAYSVFDVRDGKRVESPKGSKDRAMPDPQARKAAAESAHEDITNPRILDELSKWLGEHGRDEKPFFLFVHMWDVHFDFIPPAPYNRMWNPGYTGWMDGRGLWKNPRVQKGLAEEDLRQMIALYDGEISWTDHHVGKILDLIDGLGKRDSTLVVVTGDHGEEFFEHGKFGHHKTIHGEVVNVPLVMRFPGRIAPGTRSPALARMIDVTPTILDLVGLAPVPCVMGRPLASAVGAGKAESGMVAVSELVEEGKGRTLSLFTAVRTLDWKLLTERLPGGEVGYIGLWDLKRDPTEQVNLVETDGALKRRAIVTLDATCKALVEARECQREMAVAPSGSQGEVPIEVQRRLRELGYVGDEEEAEEEGPKPSEEEPGEGPSAGEEEAAGGC